mgnify:FL=1
MPDKVLFSKTCDIVATRKGIYNDPMADVAGFKLLITDAPSEEGDVTKGAGIRRRRHWGEDPEFDRVMENFGMTPGKPGEEVAAQLVFGWANVSVQEDGTTPMDWQGDMIETSVLESAAYNFVLEHGLANQEHEYGTECGWLVESMMFTKDKMAAMGIPEGTIPEGWFVGFYIPDPVVYQKVLDGEYNMFSIEGRARRIELDNADTGICPYCDA